MIRLFYLIRIRSHCLAHKEISLSITIVPIKMENKQSGNKYGKYNGCFILNGAIYDSYTDKADTIYIIMCGKTN